MLLDACVLILDDNINLVLQDDDLVEVHDLDGSEMLRRLRLRAGLVASNKQQRRVHDSCTGKHGSHEHIVTGAIDERHVSHEEERAAAARVLASLFVGRLGAEGKVALRRLTLEALVELSVGVTELDGNVTDLLLLMLNGL